MQEKNTPKIIFFLKYLEKIIIYHDINYLKIFTMVTKYSNWHNMKNY